MVTALVNSNLYFILNLPKSTIVCLGIIGLLLSILTFVMMGYSELFENYYHTLQFLKLSLSYILLFDNSTTWQNSYQIVNNTLADFTITQ